MPAGDLHGRAVGVDRLQPGDHAFFAYSDDETRWEILRIFTEQGFARDEKVGLLVDVGHAPRWVAERVAGGALAARRALRDGQLVVTNAPRFARGGFDAARLVEGARRRVDTVLAEGYSGLRSASEMSLALSPIDHLGQAVEYEAALHASLFSSGRQAHYTALCYWDERLFGGTAAMQEARAVHPVILLDPPVTLRAAVTGNRVSLSGESDLASRAEFDAALTSLAAIEGPVLVLDIAGLSFFDAHSAGAVVRLAAGLTAPRRLEVHCRSAQRRLLHLLGARSLAQLSVITTRI
jgi:hypothetical protein